MRERLDPPDVGVRIAFEDFRAERAAQGHRSISLFNSRKPIPARDAFVAYGALDECRVHVTRIKLTHKYNGGLRGPPC